ncbi:hypothetical protein EMIT0P74_180007 [Pseudomonas sp. IT-P74]
MRGFALAKVMALTQSAKSFNKKNRVDTECCVGVSFRTCSDGDLRSVTQFYFFEFYWQFFRMMVVAATSHFPSFVIEEGNHISGCFSW